MSLGNLNIQNIIVGQRQVATAWLGPVKLWPKTSIVTITASAGSHITEVTGSGEYTTGDTVTLTATVEAGYQFDGWYENGGLISSANPYVFTASRSMTLEALALVPTVNVILDHFTMSSLAAATTLSAFNVGKVTSTGVSGIQTPTVVWSATTAEIPYTYGVAGVYENQEIPLAADQLTATSSTFEQNLTDQPVTRDVTFVAADGNTYNAQVIQKAYAAKSYELTLTGITSYGYTKDTTLMPNLDTATYDGVYKSNNQGKDSTYAVARIDFQGYTEFTVWINSYAENNYDYTVASQLDATTYPTAYGQGYTGNGYSATNSSSKGKYSNTAQYEKSILSSETAPDENTWRKITYTCDTGEHHIYITYRKDSSGSTGNDTGCFIVEKG